MMKPSGDLIVLTGPSGVGKGVLRQHISAEMPWLKESVSVTTREKRPSEREGVDYFFVTRSDFQRMIETDQLIEWAEFAGNLYGTPRQFLSNMLAQGYSMLLEIDVQGALQIRRLFPEARLVFIEPPSMEVLESRLRSRNTNSEEDIRRRLRMAAQELEQKPLFDCSVINDDLEQCKQTLMELIREITSERPLDSSSFAPPPL